jgi:hypothetical protein
VQHVHVNQPLDERLYADDDRRGGRVPLRPPAEREPRQGRGTSRAREEASVVMPREQVRGLAP